MNKMQVAYFIKILIVTLSKLIRTNKLFLSKNLMQFEGATFFKKKINTNYFIKLINNN